MRTRRDIVSEPWVSAASEVQCDRWLRGSDAPISQPPSSRYRDALPLARALVDGFDDGDTAAAFEAAAQRVASLADRRNEILDQALVSAHVGDDRRRCAAVRVRL